MRSLDDPVLVAARRQAADQVGVLSRPELYALGVPRWLVRREVLTRRWQVLSDQAVCVHNGPVEEVGHWWAAVIQGGPRDQFDGAAALVAAGLTRFAVERIRVSVPRGARIRRTDRYDIRQTRRWSATDCEPSGIPRTRAEVAAVRGALWARTDREATYLLTAAVQQRVVTPQQVGEQLLRIRRDRRRLLPHAVVLDLVGGARSLVGGARSLGELDVAGELRRRGLSVPERQVLRCDSRHRYYLDLHWPAYRLVVEVDGIHHAWVENVVGDALRQNALALDGDTVLRFPLLGLRLQPEDFYAQIVEGLVAGGWRRRAA